MGSRRSGWEVPYHVKVKIKVGPMQSLSEHVYTFQKIFGPSSNIVVVSIPFCW